MEKITSLADYLGTAPVGEQPLAPRLEDITGDTEAFAKAVLNSYEFRCYIAHGLSTGEIPSPVVLRLMDLAGLQKPPDRVEHTGPNGGPIEITRVRRVVVDPIVEDAE